MIAILEALTHLCILASGYLIRLTFHDQICYSIVGCHTIVKSLFFQPQSTNFVAQLITEVLSNQNYFCITSAEDSGMVEQP